MGVIVFNGISSKDLGIRVAKPPEYQIPERDATVLQQLAVSVL